MVKKCSRWTLRIQEGTKHVHSPEVASKRHVTIEVHVSVECSKDGFSPAATADGMVVCFSWLFWEGKSSGLRREARKSSWTKRRFNLDVDAIFLKWKRASEARNQPRIRHRLYVFIRDGKLFFIENMATLQQNVNKLCAVCYLIILVQNPNISNFAALLIKK